MGEIFSQSKWIWVDDKVNENDFVLFRRKFNLLKPTKEAIVRVAAEGVYNLYVNGKPVIFFGSLNRESTRGNGYYDEIDIAKHLVKGDNVIGLFVNYRGIDGKNCIACRQPGVILECNELEIYSDTSFTAFRNGAYYTLKDDPQNCGFYGEFNVGYDATRENMLANVFTAVFESSLFTPCEELGLYPCPPYHELVKRPIPLYEFSKIVEVKKWDTEVFNGKTTITIDLGGAKYVAPEFEVFASGGEVVEICSSDNTVSGAFGDENMNYSGTRIKYTCKNGPQDFEAPVLIPASKLIVTIPNGLKLLKIGYRESIYAAAIEGDIETLGDNRIESFADKAKNTMQMCMRDTFYDTPFRERTMWLTDFSCMASVASHIFSDEAMQLVKKVLNDILTYSTDGLLFSNVMGNCPVEIPSHGLIFLSEYGALATYYHKTGDKTMLESYFEIMIKYLSMWDMASDGLVYPRDGHKRWFDYLFNIDERVLENAMYYSALKFADYVAEQLHNSEFNSFLSARINSIAEAFESVFFVDGCYKSGSFVDERANAWAVLAELCPSKNFESVSHVLVAVNNCSLYMEGFVIEALCKMGKEKEAMHRFYSRYSQIIESDCKTLPENFTSVGTPCHGYSSYALSVIFKYILGIRFFEGQRVEITPNLLALGDVKFTAPVIGGVIGGILRSSKGKAEIIIDNNYNCPEITLYLNDKKIGAESKKPVNKLTKGKNKFIV